MKKYLIALSLFMASTVFAAEPAYVVTTGGKTGTYFKVGHNLNRLIGNQGQVITSKGGGENIKRLMANEAQIATVQVDSYARAAAANPSILNEIEIMGPLYQECVYIAVNKDGKVTDEDDLQSKGTTIAVGKQGSGSADTWDYMRQLEPGYKNAAIEFSGGNRALGKLAIGGDNAPGAVMWVTKPNLSHKYIQTVLNNDQLEFISVNDADLNDKYKPTGKPIYEFEKIEYTSGFFSDKDFTTICMESVIVARSDMDEEILDMVADAVLNYKASLLK